MPDKWIEEQIVAEHYKGCVDRFGEVDVTELTGISLLVLESTGAENIEFTEQARRQKMRRLVSEHCTAVRRSRVAEATENDDPRI